MNESALHCSLVGSLQKWFKDQVSDHSTFIVYVDNNEANRTNVPPSFDGNIPDFYAHRSGTNRHYIGEAKTPKDLERPRSREQYRSFLKFCHEHPGSLLILAVPWFMSPCAKSLLRAIVKDNSYDNAEFIVLSDLSG